MTPVWPCLAPELCKGLTHFVLSGASCTRKPTTIHMLFLYPFFASFPILLAEPLRTHVGTGMLGFQGKPQSMRPEARGI